MITISELREEILKNDNYLLMGHIEPDGDCIGSLFALKWYLDKLNKSALVLLSAPPEDKYQILGISNNDFMTFSDYDFSKKKYHNCIILDSGDLERLGDGKEFTAECYIINIDHHIDNPAFGNINYIDPGKAAVGEIIYDLIKLDNNHLLNKKIAAAISTAIIADTGGFRYQNTTAEVFSIMAEMMSLGVDIYNINRAVFAATKYSSVLLKAKALLTLALHGNGKIAYMEVNKKMLQEAEAEEKEASGLVNYARDITGVEVGLVFTEIEENKTKVSLRSNSYCPVNEIAAYFGGGGHPRAAGCIINMNIKQSQEAVLRKVEEYV